MSRMPPKCWAAKSRALLPLLPNRPRCLHAGCHRRCQSAQKVFPQEDISLIGADVCYVHRIKARGKDFLRPVRTAAALLILLLGSALGLTWFHADVNMPQAQADVYAAITGAPPDDVRLITIPYCVGVALGVCVFYAIPFPHQTTPLEVKLTEYQEDMEKAEGKPIE